MVKTRGDGIQASVSITHFPGGRKMRTVFTDPRADTRSWPLFRSPPHPATNAATVAATAGARRVIDIREQRSDLWIATL
jgi:hypothetical protein